MYNFTLCMAGTQNYAFAIGNVLIGLKQHNPDLLDRVVLFHDGFADNDIKALTQIYDFIEFIEYPKNYNSYLEDIAMNGLQIQAYPYVNYATFEIFELLKNSQSVLYLDGDTCIRGDISEINTFGDIALVNAGAASVSKRLGIQDEALNKILCKNPGVIIANNTLYTHYNLKSSLTEQCYLLAQKYMKTNTWASKSIINLCLIQNKIKISKLPKKYNANLNSDCRNNLIIHQTTKYKPYKYGMIASLMPEWLENNEIWKELGGTEYHEEQFAWECAQWYKKDFGLHLATLVSLFKNLQQNIFTDILDYIHQKIYLIKDNTLYIPLLENKEIILGYEILCSPENFIFTIYMNNYDIYTKLLKKFPTFNKYADEKLDDYTLSFVTDSIKIFLNMQNRQKFFLQLHAITVAVTDLKLDIKFRK